MIRKVLCNRAGFHYNGFFIILGVLFLICVLKSLLKFFKNFYFVYKCGSWVKCLRLTFYFCVGQEIK
jgi:hypothetical protein